MKTIILVLTFISLTWFTIAQNPDYNRPFTDIVLEKEAYFNQLRLTLSESEFYEESGEYNEYQRWYAFWLPRIAPNGTMADYDKRLADPSILPLAKSVGNVDDWRELGPVDKPVPGPFSSIGGGDFGIGLINALIIHRNNPNKLLANTKAGGLFYSEDKGKNWTNAGSDKWWRSGCHSMEFDPDDEDVWYAASTTGGHYYSPPIGHGGGIYRTVDAGLNWFIIADKNDLDTDPNVGAAAIVNAIKVDPSNPNVGYIGTSLGLFRSTNINDVTPSNVSWVKVINGYIEDIEFKTDNSSTVFVTHKNGSGSWFISQTLDGGNTWNPLPGMTFGSISKLIVEVTDANSNYIYVVDHAGTSTIRLYNYALNTWTTINTSTWATGYGHAFCVSNFNTNYMYIFTGIYFKKSSNGGATFTTVSATSPSTAYHVDVEDIVTPHAGCASCSSSQNEVYVTTHGGVNFSSDNVTTLVTRSKGLGVAKVTEPSSAATDPSRISMGLDHDGTVLSNGSYSSNWTPGWKSIYGGDGGFTEIDYSNEDILWYESQVSRPRVSFDGALTSSSTSFPLSNDFYTEMIQNQTYPNILYSKARAGGTSTQYEEVYRSSNYGVGSVEQISKFQLILPANQWVWGIFPARTNPNYLYANVNANAPTWVGHFYRTTIALDAATTVKDSWVELDVPSGGNIKGIDVRDEDVAYFSAGGESWDPTLRLYRVDYSNPATAISTMVDISGDPVTGGLPDMPINSMVMELGSNGGIYVSTDIGIYYANNTTIRIGGTSQSVWTKLGTNLPNIPWGKLEINYISNTVRVASPGRGIWEHDLWCPTTASAYYSGAQTGTQYLEVYNGITSTASITGNAQITYRAGTSIQLNPGFFALPSGKGAKYFEAFIHPCMYIGSSPYLKNTEDGVSNSTNIENLEDPVKQEIKIYPNPSSDGLFTLSISNDEEYDIVVYNSIGMEVYRTEKANARELKIDLSMLEGGVYLARCTNDHDLKSITFIKR